ncbi:MAG TPA: hypothetical protein VLA16_01460 [Ideonella sp.]|nr:hypothetical protein [Ideonella sp.]
MTSFKRSLVTSALLLWAATLPALAASSAASSASDSSATSVGSLSGSIEKSSNSSSKGTDVSEGDYKIIDVAAVAERPGTVRVQLQPVAATAGEDGGFALYLPYDVAERSRLAQGGTVTAQQRAYGLQFSQATLDAGRQAFFLVLNDDWYQELQSKPVVL